MKYSLVLRKWADWSTLMSPKHIYRLDLLVATPLKSNGEIIVIRTLLDPSVFCASCFLKLDELAVTLNFLNLTFSSSENKNLMDLISNKKELCAACFKKLKKIHRELVKKAKKAISQQQV